ncbi:MAG: LPS export ABC transporter periplasmic protein LptC [Saprospiraceae bacterium]|nr:LPS export ABC transporter periplasmic protein LptC [Saprospiraceae bacterium]
MRYWIYLLLITLAGCVNDLAEVNQLFEQAETGTEVAKDIEMLYSDSAVVRVRIIGPTLIRYLEGDKPRDEFPDGVHVDFLEEDGSVNSTLDAQYAERFTRENLVIVRSNLNDGIPVILKNNRGEKLETSELIWDEGDSKVYTDKFVKITKPEEIIFAYGFTANQDFSQYTLQKVVGRVKVDDNEFKN